MYNRAEMPAIEVAPPRSVRSPIVNRIYWAALLLSLPALLPLAGALIVPYLHNRVCNGFIEDDLPSYVANARRHFNQGFHLFYRNPYGGENTPAIYFQPHIFLLGLMQQLGF